ncbi:MAG: cytidine deaminase [Lachnospiraceae bacterium]|nr:cytidine deaminase [Lachnospiraceae bacterium]
MNRPSKDEYYLGIADAVLRRSTCLRRHYGAVIVNNDEIISTGYNGSPRGEKNCCDCGMCERERLNIPKGERYELCVAVHAEQNAVISASRDKTDGATIYIVGRNVSDGSLANPAPCKICRRFIRNAGIKRCIGYVDGKVSEIDISCEY